MTEKVFDKNSTWYDIYNFCSNILVVGNDEDLAYESTWIHDNKPSPCTSVLFSEDIYYLTTEGMKQLLNEFFAYRTEKDDWEEDAYYTACNLCFHIEEELKSCDGNKVVINIYTRKEYSELLKV